VKTPRHRRWICAAHVGLLLALSLLAVTMFWLLRPYTNVTSTPFTTDRTSYVAGDTVTLTNTFCWDGTPFMAERFLVTKISRLAAGRVEFPNGYALPAIQEKYAATGCAPSTVKIELPSTLPEGEWRVEYRTSYRANPIRVVSVETPSNSFQVTAPKE
jgi:hypothetical protein